MEVAERYAVRAPVVAQRQIAPAEYDLRFLAPEIAGRAQPGQFVELTYGEGCYPLLRRPFSLFDVDRQAGVCRVLYRMSGAFTTGLCHLRAGDVVDVIGPLGRPFRRVAGVPVRHVLIAGGIGAPPIHFLARELMQGVPGAPGRPDVVVINGARTQELLVGVREFEALGVVLIVVTEDGTQARRGRVTEVLLEWLNRGGTSSVQVYACGPMPMLQAVSEMTGGRGVPCQVSIETSMPCGIGLCQGCAVRVRTDTGEAYALACVEGPVFDAERLVWGS